MEDNKNNANVGGTATQTNEGGNNAGENKDSKSFNQEDMDKLASKVRAEEKAKSEKAIKDAVANAMAEYDRQAKLTQEEKDKEAKAKREKELADRESQITMRERKLEAATALSEKGVPTEFVDYVVDVDAEKQSIKIDKFAKEYAKAVEKGVTDKLKGTPPKDFGGDSSSSTDTKKDYKSYKAF